VVRLANQTQASSKGALWVIVRVCPYFKVFNLLDYKRTGGEVEREAKPPAIFQEEGDGHLDGAVEVEVESKEY
jgi:hypothetical protein